MSIHYRKEQKKNGKKVTLSIQSECESRRRSFQDAALMVSILCSDVFNWIKKITKRSKNNSDRSKPYMNCSKIDRHLKFMNRENWWIDDQDDDSNLTTEAAKTYLNFFRIQNINMPDLSSFITPTLIQVDNTYLNSNGKTWKSKITRNLYQMT